jgi:hypothetical protein
LRFCAGVPSMVNCRSLVVKGDVFWGENITLMGAVNVINESSHAQTIPSGSTLSGSVTLR